MFANAIELTLQLLHFLLAPDTLANQGFSGPVKELALTGQHIKREQLLNWLFGGLRPLVEFFVLLQQLCEDLILHSQGIKVDINGSKGSFKRLKDQFFGHGMGLVSAQEKKEVAIDVLPKVNIGHNLSRFLLALQQLCLQLPVGLIKQFIVEFELFMLLLETLYLPPIVFQDLGILLLQFLQLLLQFLVPLLGFSLLAVVSLPDC